MSWALVIITLDSGLNTPKFCIKEWTFPCTFCFLSFGHFLPERFPYRIYIRWGTAFFSVQWMRVQAQGQRLHSVFWDFWASFSSPLSPFPRGRKYSAKHLEHRLYSTFIAVAGIYFFPKLQLFLYYIYRNIYIIAFNLTFFFSFSSSYL